MRIDYLCDNSFHIISCLHQREHTYCGKYNYCYDRMVRKRRTVHQRMWRSQSKI